MTSSAPIDAIIRYALSVASELEFPHDSLTKTTLIKVVYLADLAHATREGTTFTSARWIFLHFGPWCAAVDDRLEPATQELGGEIRRFDGGVAFSARRGVARGTEVRDRLPPHVTTAIRRAVLDYRGEPNRLLHHVYRTGPMLRAAPEEELVFERVAPPAPATDSPATPTERQKKRLREKARHYREQRGLAADDQEALIPVHSHYDEIYRDGVAWLDTLGTSFPEFDGLAVVDETMWKSPARGLDDEQAK